MYDKANSDNNQDNQPKYFQGSGSHERHGYEPTQASGDVTYLDGERRNLEYRDLTPPEQAHPRTHIADPTDRLYQFEDYIYDNAPPHIKEIISEAIDEHNSLRTIDDLDNMVHFIKMNQVGYIMNGIYYNKIMITRMYKSEFSNFNTFCQVRVGKTSNTCKNIIKASNVAMKLIGAGHTNLPLCVSHALVLAGLDDEHMLEVWETALTMYAMHEITEKRLKLLAYPPEPGKLLEKTSIDLLPSVYEHVVVAACKLRITVNDYIRHLIKLQKCKFSLLLNLIKFQV